MVSVIQRFEQRLESVVTGAFARAFRSAVQPVEIAAALQREADNSVQVLTRDRLLAPNLFSVELSAQDYDRLAPFSDTLTAELARLVEEHVDAQRYALAGDIRVDLVEDAGLGTGRFRVTSATGAAVVSSAAAPRGPMPPPVVPSVLRPADPVPHDLVPEPAHDEEYDAAGEPEESAAGPDEHPFTPAEVLLEINGTLHPVPAPGVVVGRGSEADLCITDPGISRRHAWIGVTHDGRTRVEVTDLESTNGVILNGRRVGSAVVPDGSELQLGSTRIIVQISDATGADV